MKPHDLAPLHEETLRAREHYCALRDAHDSTVFGSDRDRRVSRTQVWIALDTWMKAAKKFASALKETHL